MILLTGGSGRLGTEIPKVLDVWAPTRKELDITCINLKGAHAPVDLIIHAAAYTDVDRAESDRRTCYDVNVVGTRNLARLGIPMLYISTDSVFDGEHGGYLESDIPYPQNYYSLTKYLGELEVRDGVILRCSPKPRPWDRDGAFTDRFSSSEYTDVLAGKIAKAVKMFNRLPKILHIGCSRRTHFEMAVQSRPNVHPMQADKMTTHPRAARRGQDYSLDCSLWEALNG